MFSVDARILKFKLDLDYGNGKIEFIFWEKIITFGDMGFFFATHNLFFRNATLLKVKSVKLGKKMQFLVF